MRRPSATAAAIFLFAATRPHAAAGLVVEEATNDWTTNNLVVSYDSQAGLENIEEQVGRAQQRGSAVEITGATTFKLARPITAEMAANYEAAVAAAYTSAKKLEDGIESSPEIVGRKNLGFVYVATDSAAEAEAQFRNLVRLGGVTTVERDVALKAAGGGNNNYLRHASRDDGKSSTSSRRLFHGDHKGGGEILFSGAGFTDDCESLDLNDNECTPYGIKMVNITHLWDRVPKKHVKVCVIDSGYDLGHPDLPFDVAGWHPKVSPLIMNGPPSASVAFGTWNDDEYGHGSHVAGIIGAIGGNGRGVVGVLRDPSRFSLHIAKGLGFTNAAKTGVLTLQSSFMDAINSCVAEGSNVINMSFRCDVTTNQVRVVNHCYLVAYDQFLDDIYDQNILMVGAAGNFANDVVGFPQSHKSVISVANVDGKGKLNDRASQWNEQVELAGPGTNVWSTTTPNSVVGSAFKGLSYKPLTGTSMAAPHVAGVAAFLISHFPDCTNNQIRNAMIRSTTNPPEDKYNSPGWNPYYGWGIVNAGQAYELLDQGCEYAGGAYIDDGLSRLSDMASGGENQKIVGCVNDEQCADENPCRNTLSCIDHRCVTDTNGQQSEGVSQEPFGYVDPPGYYTPSQHGRSTCGADFCCPNTGECKYNSTFPQCAPPPCEGNTEDWTDAVGDSCDWYSSFTVPSVRLQECLKYKGEMGLAVDNCCTCPPRPPPPGPSPATTPYPTYVPTTDSPTLSPIYSPSTVPSFSTSPSVSLQPSGQPSTCSNTITVSIWTDGSPGENYYNITDACTGEHVGGSDPSGFKPELAIRPNVFYEKKYCVESSRYVFSIYDTYGDGMCCGNSKLNSLGANIRPWDKGSFIVEYNGKTVAVGGDFGFEYTKTFGDCASSVAPTPGPTRKKKRAKSAKSAKSMKLNLLSETLDSGAENGEEEIFERR